MRAYNDNLFYVINVSYYERISSWVQLVRKNHVKNNILTGKYKSRPMDFQFLRMNMVAHFSMVTNKFCSLLQLNDFVTPLAAVGDG